MTRLDIAHQRLLNQQLARATFKQPSEVVGWLGAVQAQEYTDAKWALGLRLENATDATVEQAFTEGTILRTHAMRPTWHFVTSTDIRWMLELTAPRVHARSAYYARQLELDGALLHRSEAAITKALRGGQHLLRSELGFALSRVGIEAKSNRLSHIMLHAELEGIVCSGPRRGKQFTYALLDERAPQAKTLTKEEALAELTRRYFTSHGPATVLDFAWWSGLSMVDIKVGLALLDSQLNQEVIDGQAYWFCTAARVRSRAAVKAYLLPVFDEYTVAYKDRSALFDTIHKSQIRHVLSYVIVVAGKIVGTWKSSLKQDMVAVEIKPFTRLTTTERRAVFSAAQRYGAFLELPVVVT